MKGFILANMMALFWQVIIIVRYKLSFDAAYLSCKNTATRIAAVFVCR